MNIRDKILIVEDERSITNFLRTILTSNDYDVIIARSGAEAYSMITSHCPDLIVLDLGLPDIDGLQIIKSVREWTLLPIVVVSARARARQGRGSRPRRGRLYNKALRRRRAFWRAYAPPYATRAQALPTRL